MPMILKSTGRDMWGFYSAHIQQKAERVCSESQSTEFLCSSDSENESELQHKNPQNNMFVTGAGMDSQGFTIRRFPLKCLSQWVCQTQNQLEHRVKTPGCQLTARTSTNTHRWSDSASAGYEQLTRVVKSRQLVSHFRVLFPKPNTRDTSVYRKHHHKAEMTWLFNK